MSDVLKQAEARRQELQVRLAEVRQTIEYLRKQQEDLTMELNELDAFFRVAAKYDPNLKLFHEDRDTISPTNRRRIFLSGITKKNAIVEFAREAIKEHGALTASRLLELIDEAGRSDLVGGRDPRGRVANLSATLSRDNRFYSDREAGGYIYKETAPTGGNQPGQEEEL